MNQVAEWKIAVPIFKTRRRIFNQSQSEFTFFYSLFCLLWSHAQACNTI